MLAILLTLLILIGFWYYYYRADWRPVREIKPESTPKIAKVTVQDWEGNVSTLKDTDLYTVKTRFHLYDHNSLVWAKENFQVAFPSLDDRYYRGTQMTIPDTRLPGVNSFGLDNSFEH